MPGPTAKPDRITILGPDGSPIGVNNPLPTDGDSVYCKDIWADESDIGGFSGCICDLFDNLHSEIKDASSDNPKTLIIHFNRTIIGNAVGLGSAISGDFSNVKIQIRNSGGVDTTVIDESSDNTKYTTKTYQLPVTAGFNALVITFHTTDAITLSNCVVLKTRSVVARLQAKKPDNTITDINATAGGNLKISLEELENTISVNGNSQLRTTIYDELGIPASVDDITETLQIIDYAHHEIHSGSHYYIEGMLTMTLNQVLYIKLVTPDTTKWAHFLWDIQSSDILEALLYEGASGGMTGGAGVTPINNNRNSANTSGVTITSGVTVATDLGTLISQCKWGTKQAGGGNQREDEIMLKQNETYLRKFTSGANGNLVCFKANWYEHTNKN